MNDNDKFDAFDFIINEEDEVMLLLYAREGEAKDAVIEIDAGNDITLTEKGQKIAESIYERHEIIAHMLLKLGVPEETAYADACKIEHDLSPITFEKIKLHYQAYSGK